MNVRPQTRHTPLAGPEDLVIHLGHAAPPAAILTTRAPRSEFPFEAADLGEFDRRPLAVEIPERCVLGVGDAAVERALADEPADGIGIGVHDLRRRRGIGPDVGRSGPDPPGSGGDDFRGIHALEGRIGRLRDLDLRALAARDLEGVELADRMGLADGMDLDRLGTEIGVDRTRQAPGSTTR